MQHPLMAIEYGKCGANISCPELSTLKHAQLVALRSDVVTLEQRLLFLKLHIGEELRSRAARKTFSDYPLESEREHS